MSRGPAAFRVPLRHAGGGWFVVGQWRGQDIHWQRNPRLLLPRAWLTVVAIWRQSQGGMGRGWLPHAGGVHDQPAWLVEAFAILASEDARIDRQERPR